MGAQIFNIGVPTSKDLLPEQVLEVAKQAGLKHLVVLGSYEDGSEYFASTQGDAAEVLWKLERAKKRLLDIVDKIAGN